MFATERLGSRIVLPTPNPEQVEFLPSSSVPAGLSDALFEYFGPVKTIIGYGSGFNGTRSDTSRLDVILVADSVREFHTRNIDSHPNMYGFPHNPDYHSYWNRFGLTYYRTEIPIKDQQIPVKVALIETPTLQEMASDGYREGIKVRNPSRFDFALQHRLQKYALAQVTPADDLIKTAIMQARELGLVCALSFLSRKTYLPFIKKEYVDTYKFDVRIERPGKVNSILSAHDEEYNLMIAAMMEQFENFGLVRKLGEGKYERLFTPDKVFLKNMIRDAKSAAVFSNYVKNLLTGGLGSGLNYVREKITRAVNTPAFVNL